MAIGAILDLAGFQGLIDALHERGYRVLGPRLRDGVLVLDDVTALADLPAGIGDDQQPGRYRTTAREDPALFTFAATAQSAKPALFPADEILWRGVRTVDGIEVRTDPDPQPVALLGVRGCDLAAITIQDAVLGGRAAADARYVARRAASFLVAVTCAQPAGTCFCASMGTGPKPGEGADLLVTELLDADGHRFLVEVGSAAGQEVLAGLTTAPVAPADRACADAVVARAVTAMGRALDTDDLRDLLYGAAESPHWNDVATRCLSCTNCTMVCPTCFCTGVEDVTDLTGSVDDRHRVWDSCFAQEHSQMHGGAVRTSIASRYRQWLTHKFASWVDQFGMSGCVGCGRCITWCPAGIDLTTEVDALRGEAERRAGAAPASHPAGPPGTARPQTTGQQ